MNLELEKSFKHGFEKTTRLENSTKHLLGVRIDRNVLGPRLAAGPINDGFTIEVFYWK